MRRLHTECLRNGIQMARGMKMMHRKSLIQRSLMQFVVCMVVLLLLTTPLFYWLTRNFYAEDMIKVVNTVRHGGDIPDIDLEEDIVQGVMIQFALVAAILFAAMVIVLRFVSRRLWLPFYDTLGAVERFRLEDGVCPVLRDGGIEEFHRLNTALERMMQGSLRSYRMQKEFTANASHELQTPLAVFQGKLDMLLQQPGITASQVAIIQDLYQMSGRLSRLSRDLLLLAKMENGQFSREGEVDVVEVLDELSPYIESLADGLRIEKVFIVPSLRVNANRPLLESMISNLAVNAVRHNKPGGEIVVAVESGSFSVANTSDEGALDGSHIFDRFYRVDKKGNGYGLGLAIVKAVCDYHGWSIEYSYSDGMHRFTVTFGQKRPA